MAMVMMKINKNENKRKKKNEHEKKLCNMNSWFHTEVYMSLDYSRLQSAPSLQTGIAFNNTLQFEMNEHTLLLYCIDWMRNTASKRDQNTQIHGQKVWFRQLAVSTPYLKVRCDCWIRYPKRLRCPTKIRFIHLMIILNAHLSILKNRFFFVKR